MHAHVHPLHELFAQLGLPEDSASIKAFIRSHRPLPAEQKLADAPFWSDHQRAFLREAIKSDADWSHVVDTLDMQLREPPELEMA
jgi:hypothetical protein